MLEFLWNLLAELIGPVLRVIFYPLGWPVVKLLTLGRYPLKGSWFRDTRQTDFAALTGVIVALVGMMVVLGQFGGT